MKQIFLILVLLSALLTGCREPGPGSVSGQILAASADGALRNLAGAQVVLRGAQNTHTTVSDQTEANSDDPAASYNYRFENLPPGTYTMAVTPPAGSGLQPEDQITLEVKADELYPQNAVLLPEGVAKPRPLTPGELNPGETGYVNGRGERVVHQQGSGFDTSDFLLMYLLMRNPPAYGYGAPPIIINNPGSAGSNAPRYRVEQPPTTTRSGQTVTRREPSVAGQGATRPGAAPAAGAGPSRSGSANGSSSNGSAGSQPAAKDGASSSGAAPASKNGSSSSGSGSNGSSDAKPSQGSSRPSSGAPRPSAPSSSGGSRSGGSSSGGRK